MHLLRHTYASHVLWEGGELRGLADLLGHANTAYTSHYARSNLPHLRKTAAHHPRWDTSQPRPPNPMDELPALVQDLKALRQDLGALRDLLEQCRRMGLVVPPRPGTEPMA